MPGVQSFQFQQPKAFSGDANFGPLSDLGTTLADAITRQKAADALGNTQAVDPGSSVPGAQGPSSAGGPGGFTPLQPPQPSSQPNFGQRLLQGVTLGAYPLLTNPYR